MRAQGRHCDCLMRSAKRNVVISVVAWLIRRTIVKVYLAVARGSTRIVAVCISIAEEEQEETGRELSRY